MLIAVLANEEQWNEVKSITGNAAWLLLDSLKNIPAEVNAIFIIREDISIDFSVTSKPIFINSVSATLKELKAPLNVVRINGWKGFLLRPGWEIAGNITSAIIEIFTAINKKFIEVPDEPGFIAARILAMIINEAWFALEENISTREQIDIAMKLGTNYPYGPFEWGEIIGEKNILALLQKLNITDKRYLPASLLQQNIIA